MAVKRHPSTTGNGHGFAGQIANVRWWGTKRIGDRASPGLSRCPFETRRAGAVGEGVVRVCLWCFDRLMFGPRVAPLTAAADPKRTSF